MRNKKSKGNFSYLLGKRTKYFAFSLYWLKCCCHWQNWILFWVASINIRFCRIKSFDFIHSNDIQCWFAKFAQSRSKNKQKFVFLLFKKKKKLSNRANEWQENEQNIENKNEEKCVNEYRDVNVTVKQQTTPFFLFFFFFHYYFFRKTRRNEKEIWKCLASTFAWVNSFSSSTHALSKQAKLHLECVQFIVPFLFDVKKNNNTPTTKEKKMKIILQRNIVNDNNQFFFCLFFLSSFDCIYELWRLSTKQVSGKCVTWSMAPPLICCQCA